MALPPLPRRRPRRQCVGETAAKFTASLAALPDASPGASVSANIALQVIQSCFPKKLRAPGGQARMKAMLPTFDLELGESAAVTDYTHHSARCDKLLQLYRSTNSMPQKITAS